MSFSPKNKGNVCTSCGSVFSIKYNYDFSKKPFDDKALTLEKDELADSLQTLKCSSCGANLMLSRGQMQTNCPYCGNSAIVKQRSKKLMYIDSIIPFAFDKNEALKKFKTTMNRRFYANKKLFKKLTEQDINGAYVNAFVFDFNTVSNYSGTFSYTSTETDAEGKVTTKTNYKNVYGQLDKAFKNITVEANSNLEQRELFGIMPFDYASSVVFKDEFMHGYMLEYQDKMFADCVKTAERIMEKAIKDELLRKYDCEQIVNLSLNISYSDKKYNYCLLPVYFITRVDEKNKPHKVIMNGQTGKVGRLPKSRWKIALTALLGCSLFVGICLLFAFLFT